MIASHELNFGSRIIFKRLYVVLVLQGNGLWNFVFLFPYRCCDYDGCCHCLILSFVQGCRQYYIECVAWLLSQSLLALLFAADDCGARIIFAFSLNKHVASPGSRNRVAIHAFIESLIRPFVIDSYYSEILKSCHALVIVHLEVGVLYDK